MKKIVFLTSANSWHVPVKTKYFVSKGYKVYYLKIYPGGEKDISPNGVSCINIKTPYKGLVNKILQLFIVNKELNKIKPDILHIISMYKSYFALFVNVKNIVFENNGSDVLIRPKKNKFYRYYYKFIYQFAKAVVQDSKISQKAGINYGAPLKFNQVIELGIDFKIFNKKVKYGEVRKKFGLLKNELIFSPRGLTPLYNIDTIIKTIPIVKKRFPSVKYLFCYNNNMLSKELSCLIDELGVLNDIIYLGFLDNDTELRYYLRDVDVVVSVPSSDSSPRSVYEAMACYANVIVSELPWYHGKFKKNKNINVIPVKDFESLSRKIIDVLEQPELVNRESAYKYVYEKINMESSSRKLEQLYIDLLKQDY